MEILFGIFLLFGGVGLIANRDANNQAKETIIGKEIRFIQETKEVIYKQETLGGWRKVQ